MAGKTSAPVPTRTAVVEDYLELVNTRGHARVVDIAERPNISQASVTNMVQRPAAEDRLKYEKIFAK